MKLLIALPALNEEQSIASTIERTLAAGQTLVAQEVVSRVEIVVVSDGSTDRTVEIARRYEDRVRLIVFPRNRGYGAAIQEAWRQSDADLLAFMDVDGTCDPLFFGDLCRALNEKKADIALGSRLAATSQMQPLRRLGNRLFSGLLSVFAGESVVDTASGMRVVRRERVRDLLPLPTGMNFTPAMSARALLAGDVRLIEVAMPYAEREGSSKLQPIRDGFRFLGSIVDSAYLFRPARILEPIAAAVIAVAALLMIRPAAHYVAHRSVEEWMIYRFLVSQLLGTFGLLTLGASHIASRLAALLLRRNLKRSPIARAVVALLEGRRAWFLSGLLVVAGGIFVAPGAYQLLTTGHIAEHWSRFVAMSFLVLTAGMFLILKALDYTIDLLAAEVNADRSGW